MGSSEEPLTETAPDLDNLEALSFATELPGGVSVPTPVVTRRHDDHCAFSALPEEHPVGSLRWPLPVSVRKRMLISHTLPGSGPVSRPVTGAPASEEAWFDPCRRSGKPAKRRVARKRARLRPRRGLSSRSAVAYRSRRRKVAQRTVRPDKLSAKRACVDVC